MQFDDLYFMKQALLEAEKSLEKNEVPVGAVIVVNQKIIGRGHNLIENLKDVTAHAEMQAITAASNFFKWKVFGRMYFICYIGTLHNVWRCTLLG